MEKRFLVALALVATLGLFIMSGSGCSGLIHGESSPVSSSPTIESEFRSYVTPDCLSIQEVLQDVIGAPPYELSQAGFDAIRDWVADNIAYKSDQEHWRGDYWQTPEETLSYRTGDCEDFAILLCSLLRAYGIDAERVYVTLGVDGGEDGHAFLVEDWYYDGEWRRLESQSPAELSSYGWLGRLGSHPDSELGKYEITTVFNDVYYHEDGDESFSWGKDQGKASTITKIITTVGDIVRGLSRLTAYLLGLLFS